MRRLWLVATLAGAVVGCEQVIGLNAPFIEPDAGPAADAGLVDAPRGDGTVHHTSDAGHDAGTPPKHDAGKTDASRAKDAEAGATCGSKVVPNPPPGPDVDGGVVFWLALHTIDFGENDGNNPPGYDLDRLDTCCMDAGPSCVSSLEHCDFAGGVDNVAAGFIMSINAALSGFSSTNFTTSIDNGTWTLLIEISGYGIAKDGGGVGDDPNVSVALFASPGLLGAGPGMPQWDGDDSWHVATSAVGDGGIANPRYTSAGAYVTNHVLVAAIPETVFTVLGETEVTFRLTAGFLTGTLEVIPGDPPTLQISDGVLAARWAERDVFASIASYRDDHGNALCTNSLFWDELAGNVCNAPDILVDPGELPSNPCDAISMALGFTAQAVQVPSNTDIAPTPGGDGGCPPQSSPADASCL